MEIVQPWFALQTRPRNEKKVDNILRQKGYECLAPTYRYRRKWSDRIVEIDLPLFPTYVFCRLSSSALGKAISTSGVIRIVGFRGSPAEVAVEEIEALQLLMQTSLLREPWKYLPGGTPVLVETGPLAGICGDVLQAGGSRQLIISVTLLQQSVAIQLDESTVVSVVPDLERNLTMLDTEQGIAVSLLRKHRT